MEMTEITLRLSSDLIKRAQEQGLLNSEHIANLLEAEIERRTTWEALDKSLEPVRAAFRADHADMSEDEIMAMINEIVHEVRSESDNDVKK